MKVLLDGLLPRIFPKLEFVCIAHEGKKELENSISRKLRAWREPEVRFVVVQDNDNGDCLALKQRLLQRCREGEREDTLVRIVCQELEAWYLGGTGCSGSHLCRRKITQHRQPVTLSRPGHHPQTFRQYQTTGARLLEKPGRSHYGKSFDPRRESVPQLRRIAQWHRKDMPKHWPRHQR